MSLFLQKIVFVLSIIAIVLGTYEWYARQNDDSCLMVRKMYFEENKNIMEGAVLGPSHVMRAINPEYFDHNVGTFALPECSFGVSHLFFKEIRSSPNLKFIILDFSTGYLSSQVTESWLKRYRVGYYFSLELEKRGLSDFFYIQYPLIEAITSKACRTNNKWGFFERINNRIDKFKKLEFDSIKIANHYNSVDDLPKVLRELIDDSEYKDNVEKLKEIATYAKANDIKLFLISPPKYYIYNDLLEDDMEYMEERNDALKHLLDEKNIFFWNYEKTYQYDARLFMDFSHMNTSGAEFFTKELNHRINEVLKEEWE